MELVLTLLAVILLVVLPISFLVLMIWGLFYSISRAIRGERKVEARVTEQGSSPGTVETNVPERGVGDQRILK